MKVDEIRADFDRRFKALRKETEDIPLALEKALEIPGQTSWDLFRVTNDNLEGAEYLVSFLINGLLDDGTIVVKREKGVYPDTPFYFFGNGGDMDLPVKEEFILEIIEDYEEKRAFYHKNRDVLDGWAETEEESAILREYFDLHNRIVEKMKNRWEEQEKHREAYRKGN